MNPDPRPRARLAHAALLIVQVLFGLFPLFVLRAGEDFAPRAIAAWRIAFGAAALGGLALALHGRAALPRRENLVRLFACALFGVVGNQTLALEGMSRSTSTNAGLLMTLIPVFTYGLAVLVRQERSSARRTAGIALSLGGALVLLLARGGAPDLHGRHLLGNALIAANCLSYSIYLLLARELVRRTPPLALIAQVYAASLLFVPLFAADVELAPAGASRAALLALAYILVFATALAYLLNVYALERVSASTTAIYIYVQPLVAGAAGVLALGERLEPRVWVAAALLFAGIWLATARSRVAPAPG